MIELRSIRSLPPFCFCVALLKLMTGSLKLSRKYLGMEVNNETGEVFRIFRNITTKKIDSAPDSCVFIVSFKFRHLSHQANKIASIIPMLLIAGFPGFIQKLYAYNPENGYWQGMYEWKSMKYLQAYQKSFVYRMMNRRAIKESLKTQTRELSKLINLFERSINESDEQNTEMKIKCKVKQYE